MVIAMYGHAGEEEIEYIRDVERRTATEPSPETMLELGVLYIEPAHREAEAIELFESVLKMDPSNSRAQLWLAYCCIHYLMDKIALQRAIAITQRLEGDRELGGAAAMLWAEALEDAGELVKSEKVRLLEMSVRRSPDWVNNRERLAWAYEESGRFEEALEHVRKALANLETFSAPRRVSTESRTFEELITGRGQLDLQEELIKHAFELEARL